MQQILGEILKNITEAQVYSDMATIRIGKLYKKDPILRHFPIPRSEVGTVKVDLKFALSIRPQDEPNSHGTSLTQEDTHQILETIKVFLNELPSNAHLKNYTDIDKYFAGNWRHNLPQILSMLEPILPKSTGSDVEVTVEHIVTAIEQEILRIAISQNQDNPDVIRAINQVLGWNKSSNENATTSLKEDLRVGLTNILAQALEGPSDDGDLKFIIETEKLENMASEKLNSASLTINLAKREWSTVTVNGKSHDKMISM